MRNRACTMLVGLALVVGQPPLIAAPPRVLEDDEIELVVKVVDGQRIPLPGATVFRRGPGRNSRALTNVSGVVREIVDCGTEYDLRVSFAGLVEVTETVKPECGPDPLKLTVRLDEEIEGFCLTIGPCGTLLDLERTHHGMIFSSRFLQDMPGAGGVARRLKPPCPKPKKKKNKKLRAGSSSEPS